MIEEFDDIGPLRSRTATPGRTPEQHAANRSIKAVAIIIGTGMVPRCDAAESPKLISDAVVQSIAMRRSQR
jgi:NAD/NADP transhydrogenase alpha subunit